MNFRNILLVFTLLFSTELWAAVDAGIGFSSYTSGQSTPSLLIQGNNGNIAFDFTTTGYASQYDYLAGYSSSYYNVSNLGRFLTLNLDLGFGGGIYYSERGFRMTESSDINKSTDFGIGPSFFLRLNIGDYLFVRIQSLLGMGHGNNLLLIFQDVSNFSVGFRW